MILHMENFNEFLINTSYFVKFSCTWINCKGQLGTYVCFSKNVNQTLTTLLVNRWMSIKWRLHPYILFWILRTMDTILDLWEINRGFIFCKKKKSSSFIFYLFSLHCTMPTVFKRKNKPRIKAKGIADPVCIYYVEFATKTFWSKLG